ncbi:MAG: DUF1854 domain-containing protein [Ruminococcaceae bacterium]|nr:DUF1854 domain-containing protein [Oscillospiraceae bacterium]
MKRLYIDSYTGRLTRSDLYLVDLTLKDGTLYKDLEPRRLFPVSNTEMYISLLDEHEKEIALVRDLKELDPGSAEVLRACFREYYRIPRITRLVESVDRFGSLTWTVETESGPARFRIRNRHNDIKHLAGNRILVRDTNDNRYEIADWTQLDTASRRKLFAYL